MPRNEIQRCFGCGMFLGIVPRVDKFKTCGFIRCEQDVELERAFLRWEGHMEEEREDAVSND